MLPPAFEHKNTHRYGTFSLTIHSINTPRLTLNSIEPHFFGNAKYQHQTNIQNMPLTFQYAIATNLWHFYSYLTDCKVIPLIFTDQTKGVYSCQVSLNLLSSSQVMNKFNVSIDYLFEGDSYLTNSRQKLQLLDRAHRKVGDIQIEVKVKFNEDINRVLYNAELIDFDSIFVVDEISPIPSSLDLPSQILPSQAPVKHQIQIKKFNKILEDDPIDVSPPKPEEPFWKSSLPSKIELKPESPRNLEDDQKMLEDDIDRLVAEMQNRPYDSSRYVESNSNQNVNYANSIYSGIKSTSTEKKIAKNSCQKLPPKYPTPGKGASSSPNRSFQPILSYTMNTPMEPSRSNYLLNTTSSPLTVTRRTNSRQNSCNNRYEHKNGIIKLKIHELVMQRMEAQLSLILKLYLNDSQNEFYTTNSLRQGQAIMFNSNVKIDQKMPIDQLKFELIESYDMKTLFAHGTFDMQRLYDQNPSKGIFMVNMLNSSPNRSTSASKVIRVDEQQVTKVMPNLKSLRIQLEYEQPIEIVQIYLSLSDFSKVCKSCRYKIPLTKETIEFRISQLHTGRHVNIFPHNRSSGNRSGEKIIVELWGQCELIGLNQVNLKQLYNTNQKMINASLEPIYLYDENRQVTDLKGSKTKGSFTVKLCYGTISQVQSLINQNPRRQMRVEHPKKLIQVEKEMGIIIKENKQKKEVEIQVDSIEVQSTQKTKISRSMSRKSQMNLTQQQELPDEDEEIQLNVSKKSENEFLNRTMEEKYLKQETLSKMFKKQDIHQEKATLKPSEFSKVASGIVPQRSLTKEFQNLIKQNLQNFQQEQIFQMLKDKCNGNLLYNFIEKAVLIGIFQQLGISRQKIDTILKEIIYVSNDMININMLYDLIYGLILDGSVKQKYIDDYQLGRYCLVRLYKQIKDNNIEEMQHFVFDENIEFQQARKVYQKVDFKVTMRQFKQIEQFIKKYQEISPVTSFQEIRNQLLSEEQVKNTIEEEKKNHEAEVINQLYKDEWDQDDDFFISNINQNHQQQQYLEKDKQIQYKSEKSYVPIEQLVKPASTHIFQQQDKTFSPFKREQPSINQKIEISPKKTTESNFKMSLQGFENCIEAAQCHLNIKLVAPKLKISYSTSGQSHELYINREENRQNYKVDLYLESEEEYLDGCIQLWNNNKVLAKCNFSIIKEVRSVYALKSIQQAEFCGLIYLQFNDC